MGATRIKEKDLDYWHKSHSWFASFAPADKPEIAVVVLNEHGGFGASGAAPTAMAVIQDVLRPQGAGPGGERGQPMTVLAAAGQDRAAAGAAARKPPRIERAAPSGARSERI